LKSFRIASLALTTVFLWSFLWVSPTQLIAQDDNVPSGLTIHVVQRGENLFRIALNYGMTTEELAELNGILDPSNLAIGQRLLVPNLEIVEEPVIHVVQAGETLAVIAEFYGVAIEVIVANNELASADRIFTGQELLISGELPEPVVIDETIEPTAVAPDLSPNTTTIDVANDGFIVHVVASGDTLFQIATRYGLTTADVASANNISDPTSIFAGQRIVIPLGEIIAPIDLDLPAPLTNLIARPLVFIEGETFTLTITTSEAVTMTAQFLDRSFTVLSDATGLEHVILGGIPVFTVGGVYDFTLNITGTNGVVIPYTFAVQVLDGGYGTQNLTISGELEELLAPAVEEFEINLLTTLASNVTEERYWGELLSIPAAAAMNAPYGTRRSYNGGAVDRYHNGADFATPPNTPIYASAAGRVVMADLLNIRGNAVAIDHGWGVFTTYSHLSEILVTPGMIVQEGQIIGQSGSTGRVTGAHLHWEVWVGGVAVNPLTWVQYSFP